jgi:translation initiation factor 2A
VVHGWSPDSRFFMTATTRPRMNVDNGVKVFRYTGDGPVRSMAYDELYDARWRPASKGVYENRPRSPSRKGGSVEAGKGADGVKRSGLSGLSSLGGGGVGGGGAYRPPGARGRGGTGGSSLAQLAGETVSTGPAKIKGGAGGGGGGLFPNARSHADRMRPVGLPVGAAPPPANGGMSKSAMKREKKKRKEAEEAALKEELAKLEGAAGGGGGEGEGEAAAAAAAAAAAPPAPLTAEEKAKRVKKLTKTLKAIDAIKEKQAGGAALNEDQKAKLAGEVAARDELAELQAELAASSS